MEIASQLSVLTEPALSGILFVPEWDYYVINLWMHKLELWKVCLTIFSQMQEIQLGSYFCHQFNQPTLISINIIEKNVIGITK